MPSSSIGALFIYGVGFLASVLLLVGSYLMLRNDGLNPFVGVRTQKGLNNPQWRRRVEIIMGRWLIRIGAVWAILSIVLFLVARSPLTAVLYDLSLCIAALVPLLALRTK